MTVDKRAELEKLSSGLCGQRLGTYYDATSDSDVCRDKFLPCQ